MTCFQSSRFSPFLLKSNAFYMFYFFHHFLHGMSPHVSCVFHFIHVPHPSFPSAPAAVLWVGTVDWLVVGCVWHGWHGAFLP